MRRGRVKGKPAAAVNGKSCSYLSLKRPKVPCLRGVGGASVDFFTHMVTASQEVTYNSKIEGDVTVTRLFRHQLAPDELHVAYADGPGLAAPSS